MNCCAAPPGLDDIFNARMAAREARHFQRRGLPQRARRLLAAIRDEVPLEGATSLEIGGGAGAFSLTLLREGVASATIIDASAAYVAEARRLAGTLGMSERIDIRHGAYAAQPDDRTVDLIVLDRVVCCDPDWQGLLRPASRQASRAIALSYPRKAWWTALLVRTVNFALRVMRETFRLQYHSPAAMHVLLRDAGFQPRVAGHYFMWELVVATRGRSAG